MEPIINEKNISKKYNITHQQGGYVALRDVLTNVAKRPFSFLKHKARVAMGKEKKEEFWALKNINFTVEKGEAVGIIGANGAGKSTLLKILSKITPPTEGEVTFKGKMSSLLEVGTGFHPELTGRENIFLNGAILGMTKKEIANKFDDIVAFSGVGKFLDMQVKRYSSGMSVRLAFAVAAHLEPDILIVDEVLAVGDAEFQKKCLGKMDEVKRAEGRTILFVSHNMSAVQNLCKRCILMEAGEIKMIGETKDVISKYLNNQSNLPKIPLKDRKDRRGTGKIKITNCYFLNKNREKTNRIVSGLDAELIFEYECEKNIILSDIIIGANILTPKNESIFLCHSEMSKTDFGEIYGKGKLRCKLKQIPLVPGTFFISVRITASNIELDQVTNILDFEVLPGDFFSTGSNIIHSLVYVNQKWSNKKND